MNIQAVGHSGISPIAQTERAALSSLPGKLAWMLVTLFFVTGLIDYLGAPQQLSTIVFVGGLAVGALIECIVNLAARRRLNNETFGGLFKTVKLLGSLNAAGAAGAVTLLFGDVALQGVPAVISGALGMVAGAVAASLSPASTVKMQVVAAEAQPEARSAGAELSEQDRYMVAVHEAGHALALGLVPAAWREGAFVQIGDSKSTFTHAPRDNSIWTIAPYRRWEMLLMLAGPVAADREFGAPMEGGAADMREWRYKAMAVLTAERAEGWTMAPENELEYEANQRLLKAMEREQTEALNEFFDVNRDLHRELVDHLLAHDGASPDELEAFLERVTFSDKIEQVLGL